MFKNEKIYLECECSSKSHLVCVEQHIWEERSGEIDPGDIDLYIATQMNPWASFWKRCWYALKYIFGKGCNYYHWDCCMVDLESARKLRDLCAKHIQDKEKALAAQEAA